MSQTVVRQNLRVAVPGMIADLGFSDIISRLAEEANGISFGLGVVGGTDLEKQCKLPSGTGVGFIGVAAKDHKEQQFTPTLGVNLYDDEDAVGILRSGRIWVQVVETIVAGDAVYVWDTLGVVISGALPGFFGKTADTTKNALITPGAVWIKGGVGTVAVPAIALLELSPETIVVDA